MRFFKALALLTLLWFTQAQAQLALTGMGGASIPSWVSNPQNPPDQAINWATNQAWKKNGGLTTPTALGITTVRSTTNSTNLLPTAISGFAYQTFAANTTVLLPGVGRLTYETRTTYLSNSTTPATQTTPLLPTGTYTLWVNGPGTATMSLGTGIGCGTSAATQGIPLAVTITTTGTCVVTVSGTLNAFQFELNPGTISAPSPFIVCVTAPCIRAADVTTMVPTGATAWSLFESAIPGMPIAFATNQYMLEISDQSPTGNNRILLFRNGPLGGAAAYRYSVATSTVYTQNLASNTLPSNVLNTMAISAIAGTQNGMVNGSLITPGTGAGTATGLTSVNFGVNETGVNQCDCTAVKDEIWYQALPPAQLQSLQ